MSVGWRVEKSREGIIGIDQGVYGRFIMSFNPDDEKFYVHTEPDGTGVLGMFKERRNANYYVRKLLKLEQAKEV